MQLPQIVQTGHPVLPERATEVPLQQIKTPEFQQLVDTMIAVMRQAPSVGLAAPQIGLPVRVIVLEDTEQAAALLAPQERREREREAFSLRVFINPVLRPHGEESRLFRACRKASPGRSVGVRPIWRATDLARVGMACPDPAA